MQRYVLKADMHLLLSMHPSKEAAHMHQQHVTPPLISRITPRKLFVAQTPGSQTNPQLSGQAALPAVKHSW
jgi:hypothetical protein